MIWLLLLIELIHEAVYGDKHDLKSNLRLALMFLIANLWGLIQNNYYEGLLYVIARVGIFDIAIALLRGHTWDYLGTTSNWDKKIKRINKWVLLSIRIVCILVVLIVEIIIK